MGSEMGVWLQLADGDAAERLLRGAAALFNEAERRLSRFDPDSELSRLNERPDEWVEVSRPLWRVMTRALQLAEETGGLFDPTLLDAMLAAGYDRPFDPAWRGGNGHVAADAPPLFGQWQLVERDGARRALRLSHGARLDLGGIAKGFTARQVVDWLSVWGPCLVDAGGDLSAGDGPAGESGWPVAVAAPSGMTAGDTPDRPALHLWLSNATLATSGVDYRWWLSGGRRHHHVIDPRTGHAAETDLLTATVLSADAARAEAWATALLVAGQTTALYRADQHDLPVALFAADGRLNHTPAMGRLIVDELS